MEKKFKVRVADCMAERMHVLQMQLYKGIEEEIPDSLIIGHIHFSEALKRYYVDCSERDDEKALEDMYNVIRILKDGRKDWYMECFKMSVLKGAKHLYKLVNHPEMFRKEFINYLQEM